MQKWMVAAKKADFKAIGEKFQIDQVVARIIRNRDVVGEENIRIFLEGGLSDLPDAHQMKDMKKLTEMLAEKIRNHRKIRIIGDYDVDGVTSSHLFLTALKRVGADVDVVIPHRIYDGYGLSIHLLEEAVAEGVDTILTCDNGIAALEEIRWAKEKRLTVLVTDHHAIPFEEKDGNRVEKESMADAVVNPHQSACPYPYKELCGAGVAWHVITVLYELFDIPKEEAEELLDFVALGTVCDVMSLTGVNRILVKEGLKRIKTTGNKGLRALMAACGIAPQDVSAYHFGFVLGPCVNATGRLDTARRALRLFETEDEQEAEIIADELVELNQERKELTRQGVEEAKRICGESGYEKDPVLVLFLPDVHESIAGLVAGKIREIYERPVFVLTRGEEGAKGSGRSTEAYSMYENMCACRDLFTKFGGHPMAAGLSLPEENIDLFRKRINETCPLTVEEVCPVIHIDMAMPVGYATTELVHQFSLLAPFGKDNPSPLFADRNLSVKRMWVLGKNKNVLRMTMEPEGGQPVSVIYFGDIQAFQDYIVQQYGAKELEYALHGQKNEIRLSIVYSPKIDDYQGNENLQLEMKCYR
ncbi:MAG: single-stranded-DNA-specific exonuclease RecJ [Lachnospiraceae bacterium]|nr:single-stranded-DNA-specific exonuclease RecJ [Lachnospiraceae bacterium]MDY4892380.1 single-stranded-DNA-specific exonuclease RecJ [Agathobacter sp.]